MRHLLRRLALRVALSSSGIALVLGALLVVVLRRLAPDRYALDLMPLSWPVAGLLLVVALTLALSTVVALVLIARPLGVLTSALNRLAQRADEFGSGGYASQGGGQSGSDGGWHTGVGEVDTVGRMLDRTHESLNRSLSAERSFAADASHQLRTPLAALLMRLDEILHTDDLAEAKIEADVAIGQTERLAGVVDDLLHRTRAGHADGGRSVSLDTVLAGLEAEWTPAFEAVGRSIVVGAERAMIVRSSASAISQILNTLVENALQHGAGRVRVAACRSGPSALIEISDEGEGIDPELSRRIFDRAVTSGAGTGLGLAVARATAESFGGRLELAETSPAVFALYVSMTPAR
ncbi:MAG: HAMP domain-containing histidine kinase [Actinobacteria bacterium]|nr:HAMP domain-containing histidine kinase [Actinomycetota bacterium]